MGGGGVESKPAPYHLPHNQYHGGLFHKKMQKSTRKVLASFSLAEGRAEAHAFYTQA